jgi:hypothetical protein
MAVRGNALPDVRNVSKTLDIRVVNLADGPFCLKNTGIGKVFELWDHFGVGKS